MTMSPVQGPGDGKWFAYYPSSTLGSILLLTQFYLDTPEPAFLGDAGLERGPPIANVGNVVDRVRGMFLKPRF